ncbi:MAG: hypothetical protein ACKO27_05885, partial [Ilumatobacteraceae bacterium]
MRALTVPASHPLLRDATGAARSLDDIALDDIALDDIAGGDGTLFVRDGIGIAGRGVAMRVEAGQAAVSLAALPHESHVDGIRPLAVGSVPFEPGSAALL